MFSLYLFALIIGGGLLLFSLLGGSDHHGGDLGHHGDLHHADLHHGNPVQWLSLRTLIYFLFVFGGVGVVLSKSWSAATAPFVFLLAAAAGVGIGAAVSATFAYLRRTDSGVRDTDDSFVGLAGKLTIPIASGGAGKVLVARGDRTFELLARAYDKASGSPSDWKNVIVVEMVRGIALVAPLDDPSVQELASLNQP
jgi:hypothetical protein